MDIFLALLSLVIFIPIGIAVMLLSFDEGNKRTIKLLLIPFGFVVLLKEKYDNLGEK